MAHTEPRVLAYLTHILQRPSYHGFDVHPLSLVKFIPPSSSSPSPSSSSQPRTTFSFTVTESISNLDGNLHGGAATTIFDNLTSTALFAIGDTGTSTWDTLGVTRSLTVTFLAPMPVGAEVWLDCEVLKRGRRMVLLRGSMRMGSGGGKLCAVCVHDKFMPETGRM